MTEPSSDESTRLLSRLPSGDRAAEEQLFALLYDDLRERAAALMREQPPGHTLQPTALVHEAWLKFDGDGQADALSRSHFLRLAGRAMRSVLVDHARARVTDKRGGGAPRCTIEEDDARVEGPSGALLALDESLQRLAAIDAEMARVAEMRLFGGLEHHEIATLMSVSTRTIERSWKAARAWLQRDLDEEEPH